MPKRAKDLRGRAASVGTGGINSDDPDAVLKLKEKLQAAETKQVFMKAANKVIRTTHKAGISSEDHPGFARYLEKLRAIPGGENCTAKTALNRRSLTLVQSALRPKAKRPGPFGLGLIFWN
jgi:hypothetical protein